MEGYGSSKDTVLFSLLFLVLQQGERSSVFPQTQSKFLMYLTIIKFNGIYLQQATALDLREYISLHMSAVLQAEDSLTVIPTAFVLTGRLPNSYTNHFQSGMYPTFPPASKP